MPRTTKQVKLVCNGCKRPFAAFWVKPQERTTCPFCGSANVSEAKP